jgi:hypothetical protein
MQYARVHGPRLAHTEIVLVQGGPRRGGGGGRAMAGTRRRFAAYAPLAALFALVLVAAFWISAPPTEANPVGLVGCSLRASQCAHARDNVMSIRNLANGSWAIDLRENRSLAGAPLLAGWAAPDEWVNDFRVTRTSRFAAPGSGPPHFCSHPGAAPLTVHRAITVHGCTSTKGCGPLDLRGTLAVQVQLEVAAIRDLMCCTCP